MSAITCGSITFADFICIDSVQSSHFSKVQTLQLEEKFRPDLEGVTSDMVSISLNGFSDFKFTSISLFYFLSGIWGQVKSVQETKRYWKLNLGLFHVMYKFTPLNHLWPSATIVLVKFAH